MKKNWTKSENNADFITYNYHGEEIIQYHEDGHYEVNGNDFYSIQEVECYIDSERNEDCGKNDDDEYEDYEYDDDNEYEDYEYDYDNEYEDYEYDYNRDDYEEMNDEMSPEEIKILTDITNLIEKDSTAPDGEREYKISMLFLDLSGKTCKKNYEKYYYDWLFEAAAHGYDSAFYQMYSALLKSNYYIVNQENFIPKLKEAIAWIEGEKIEKFYEHIGILQSTYPFCYNKEKAFYYLLKAAKNGSFFSVNKICEMVKEKNCRLSKENIDKAEQLLIECAKKGNKCALKTLIKCYKKGLNFEKNKEKAKALKSSRKK